MTITTPFSFVGPEISTTSGDATATNQATIIAHLTDIKGSGWGAADNLSEIGEDVAGLNGDAMRGTDGANTATPPTASEIVSAIMAGGDVDGYTLEESLKICMAALAGELSGAETTTITFRAADDSKDRITATVTDDGNRTSITLDAT